MKDKEWEILSSIQKWYYQNCDGDWEHNETINIYTIDNPGWRVSIDLEGTKCEDKPFEQIRLERSDTDWYRCFIREGKFEGAGGPCNLVEILTAFKDWVENLDNKKF